nr:MAG TPA: hypothetical protein [Caudoviricetes sp.]
MDLVGLLELRPLCPRLVLLPLVGGQIQRRDHSSAHR